MIIVFLLILGFKPFVTASKPLAQFCDDSISNMNDSTYQANLKLLSTKLSRSASFKQTLLAKGFVRTDQDRIYGVAVCRGDIAYNNPICTSCITTAFHDAWRLCGPYDMHVLYEYCIVHISATDLTYDSSAVLNSLMIFMDSVQGYTGSSISTKYGAYTGVSINDNIMVLIQETAKQVVYNSTMRYATGRMDLNNTIPLLYSLAQCNLDLPPNDCWDCLNNIRSTAKNFSYLQRGEWIASVWCNLWYDTYQFYEGQPMKQITWSDSVDPTTNMVAPQPAPGPVGVPRLKDKNKAVAVPSRKLPSKQGNKFFLSPKLGHLLFVVIKEHLRYIYLYIYFFFYLHFSYDLITSLWCQN